MSDDAMTHIRRSGQHGIGPISTNAPWTNDQYDYVLLARDPEASSVTVTWTHTEEGNEEVIKSRAADLVDAADLLKAAFFSDA